jgi:hypothetical protein
LQRGASTIGGWQLLFAAFALSNEGKLCEREFDFCQPGTARRARIKMRVNLDAPRRIELVVES